MTARAAPTCTNSPGLGSSDTGSSSTGRHPMTPRLPTTGHGDGEKCPCRSTRPPKSSQTLRTVVVGSAEGSYSPSRTGHRTHASGNSGWPPRAHDRHHRHAGAQHLGPGRTPSRTRRLPKRPRPGTAQRLRATRACLSPVRRKPHAGFLGGLGRSNAPGPIRQKEQRKLRLPLLSSRISVASRAERLRSAEMREAEPQIGRLRFRGRRARPPGDATVPRRLPR